MPTSDKSARKSLYAAYVAREGSPPPSERVGRLLLAVWAVESGGLYDGAKPTRPDGSPLYNVGSLTRNPPCGPQDAQVTDYRPLAKGEDPSKAVQTLAPGEDPSHLGKVRFTACLIGYPSLAAGLDAFLAQVDGSKPWRRTQTWAALQTGDPHRAAQAMLAEHYYLADDGGAEYEKRLRARIAQYEHTIGPVAQYKTPQPGESLTKEESIDYVRAVDADYEKMQVATWQAVATVQGGQLTPQQQDYLNAWNVLYPQWKASFDDMMTDILPNDVANYVEAASFWNRLAGCQKCNPPIEGAGPMYAAAFGRPAPVFAARLPHVAPVPQQSSDPVVVAAGAVTSTLQWGIGLVAVSALAYGGYTVLAARKKKAAA